MVRIKRQSIRFGEKPQKKLRTTFYDRISSFESLSNELYYEIFDYLEGCQIYKAFSNLNIRFHNLLSDSSLRLKINFIPHSEDLKKQYINIVTSNKNKLISLSLCRSIPTIEGFPKFIIDSSFNHLESLVLDDINSNELIPLLVGLIDLPRLFTLRLYFDEEPEEISNIYGIIFNLPMLKYNKISFYSFETFIHLPMDTNGKFSSIEYLVMDHPCTLNHLITILSYTPRLCRLVCTEVNESTENISIRESIMINYLKYISISKCFAEFDEMESFITKISSQLQVIRITCVSDSSYLNADRWERIILQYLTHLRLFEFQYQETIDDDFVVTDDHTMINRFNSSFWINRKWFFKVHIDQDDWSDDIIVYSIFPHRSSGKFDEDSVIIITQNIIQNEINFEEQEPISYSLNFRSKYVDLCTIDYYNSIIDNVGPILTLLKISYLNILCKDIFIGVLINLIKYLPNLHSLIISSLSMIYPRCLSVDEVQTLRWISNTNKIIRVNLHQMNDLAQVQFLLNLCPRIEHLEVNCTNDILPEKFIRFILMKNIKYIPNLSSLCLQIPQTQDYSLIDKLKEMIDFEQLHSNYTIKQTDNKISFKWNL